MKPTIESCVQKFTAALVVLVRQAVYEQALSLLEAKTVPLTLEGLHGMRIGEGVVSSKWPKKTARPKLAGLTKAGRDAAKGINETHAKARADKELTLDQETVLRAMASLGGRPSAKQIEAYTGMPNGNVGRALAQLREMGRVVKFGARQGMTYGLVSTGSVGPVRRGVISAGPGRVLVATSEVAA